MFKKLVITSGLIGITMTSAFAGAKTARVVDVEPIYQTRYNQICQDVTVNRQSTDPILPILLGAGGAAIAHKNIGNGSGQAAATVIGGIVGYELGKSASATTRRQVETQCHNEPYQVRTGKIVTFEYDGYRFSQQFND